MGRDASIIIQQVKFTYNGTFVCQVKNPPDVHGPSGEIRLRVVTTGRPPSLQNTVPVVVNHVTLIFSIVFKNTPCLLSVTCTVEISVSERFPSSRLTSSLLLWAPPAGLGYRRRHHRCGLLPHHRRVLQAVQEEPTEAAGKVRGGPPQREKRPHSVVRARGGRGVAEERRTSSLTPISTLGTRAGVSPSRGPRGCFLSSWRHHFDLFPQLRPLDLKSRPPGGAPAIIKGSIKNPGIV